jgi:hypothetical protein
LFFSPDFQPLRRASQLKWAGSAVPSVNDGSPISQSLQKADEFYARFKVKEAQGELLKVLTLDADNTKALSKLARVHTTAT